MAYREDRSVSFFGEDAYQTLMNAARPIESKPQISCFSNVFKKIMNFCSKTKEPAIPSQEPSSELFSLRTKYRSTTMLNCSTFCSNRRTEESPEYFANKEESFLHCYSGSFPKNEFFILEHKPFNVIAKYNEVKNLEKIEPFMLKQLTTENVLGLNFQICTQEQNASFCKKVFYPKIFNLIK